jgi:hypothetical protein
MGQEVRIFKAGGKGGAVSVEGRHAGLNRYPLISSEQHLYENVYSFEPVVKKASALTEFFIRVFDITGSLFLLLLTSPL